MSVDVAPLRRTLLLIWVCVCAALACSRPAAEHAVFDSIRGVDAQHHAQHAAARTQIRSEDEGAATEDAQTPTVGPSSAGPRTRTEPESKVQHAIPPDSTSARLPAHFESDPLTPRPPPSSVR